MYNKMVSKDIDITEKYQPYEWDESEFSKICNGKNVVGYLFISGKLKLYLSNNKSRNITIKDLKSDYDKFKVSEKPVYRNPPLPMWLETKDNWCKKIANKLALKYNLHFENVLSEVYLSICKCYKKGVYLGNLGYIERAIINNLLCSIRYDKNRLYDKNILLISLDMNIGDSEDGSLTLCDILPSDEDPFKEIEYKQLENALIKELSVMFSTREIEQIINCERVKYLPVSVYRRLLRFRKKCPLSLFMKKYIGE